MEPSTDSRVVLAVVVLLGLLALLGLGGVIWLVDHDADAASLIAVTGIAGPAAGALAGILATTRTTAPLVESARAEGYRQAVAEVSSLTAPS